MTQKDSEDLIAWIEESTHRAASRALRKYTVGAALAFVVLLGGLALAGKAWIDELQQGLRGSCDRVNVLRAQSNLSDSVSFNILSSSGIREESLAEDGPAKERDAHQHSADSLFAEADKLTVTVLTDCEAAVDQADEYQTPIAGPIGNPRSGDVSPGVVKILDDSESYLRHGR